MRDVAVLAGVGIKTVSRVINSEPNVSRATIERVQSAAARLNYQPDIHAGNLRRTDRRTQTLGLLVGSVANPFSGAVHRAIEDAAMARGVAVFASSLDDDPARERVAVNAFLRRRVDGLILTAVGKSQGYLLPEQERGTPIVFIDREPAGIDADAIVSTNVEGAAHATRHLIERGHRRIAFLGDRHDIRTANERRRGFLEELGRAGIPTGDAWVVEDLHDEHSAHAAVARLLAEDHRPTAIFSAQNLITIGAVRGLRDRNLQSTVALVGFDDVELGDLLDPGLTVIAQDPDSIGRLAAERIFARLDGQDVEVETIVVPTKLIERGSGEIRPPE
jgi:LacI family transcriptional regulator